MAKKKTESTPKTEANSPAAKKAKSNFWGSAGISFVAHT